jgi:Papain-like cysteine protease AvrRpt2
MAINVTGTLTADGGKGEFDGYRLTALFEVPLGDPAAPSGQALDRRTALVEAAGEFALEVPDAGDRLSQVTITVTSDSGLMVAVRTFTDAQLGAPLSIQVAADAPPTTVTPSEDITLGAHVSYSGRVIDVAGAACPPNVIVVLLGVPKGGQPTDARPLDVTATSGGGYVSGRWPQVELSGAFASVDGLDPVAIALTADGRFPTRFVIVVPELPSRPEDGEEPCECEAVPRAPEAPDLAIDSETFAADRGRCVDFTIPNRTLEEVAFQAVVRTTQPELKGTPPRRRPKLPHVAIKHLVALARANVSFGRLDRGDDDGDGLTGRPLLTERAESLIRPSNGIRSPVGFVREIAGDKITRTAVRRARTLLGGIDLDRDRINPEAPEVLAEGALGHRDLETEPLRLEPSALAELKRESTNLTPLRLLEAEHVSIVRRFRDDVVLLAAPNPQRFVLGDARQVDWDDLPLPYQATTIAHGHLLTFKQVWKADGYSLGDLLYSLPLAPGQQKLVSILDWDRRESDTRQARRTETEAFSADLRHDRDISDIISATLSERMDASSSAHVEAAGGGIGGFIGPLVFGAAGGVSSAGSTARQTSGRDVSGSALNQVRDRTLQASSAVRGQRSTVVQTSRQGEAVRATTEVVANYNHCHAMTVEYFEVLRHFQVQQELAHVQECLFVPFSVSPFTQSKALRWRHPLEAAIRRRDLRGGFDALDRVATNWAQADVPLGRYADETLRHLDGELTVQINLPRPRDTGDGAFDASAWGPWSSWLWDAPLAIWERYLGVTTPERRDWAWSRNVAPGVAQRIVDGLRLQLVSTAGNVFTVTIDTSLISPFAQDRLLTVTLRVEPNALPNWTRAQLARVRLTSPPDLPGDAPIVVDSVTFRYRTDHYAGDLITNRRVQNDLGIGDDVEMLCPLNALEKRNPRERDRRTAEDLLDHLDEHTEHYHRAIWLQMDPNRRYLLLDGFVAPDSGGRSVASVVENRVIGVVGNSLVMPVMPGVKLDSTYEFADATTEDLRHLYAGASAPPMRISTPTKGVFAEAVQGKCNSCEVIDDTRFWRFEEHPIPDRPTSIEALSTASRRRTPPSLRPDEFPDALVRLQTAPSAPDPTGLAAAMKALGTAGIFKDITGLTLNQANSAQALKTAISTAQSFATQAGALAQQRFLNEELDRSVSHIKQARDKKLISEEEAQELTESAMRGALGEVRPKAAPATESEPVKRAMERINSASKGGALRVTRPEGSVEVKTREAASRPSIDLAVTPDLVPVKQPSDMTCWAAAGTMLLSWRAQVSMSIQTAMDSLDGGWRAAFDADKGLTLGELQGFAAAVGLAEEAPASYTPEGLARLLEAHGPLWIISDDAVEANLVVHAQIITAIRGDGTTAGTTITLADSASGTLVTESFEDVGRRLEAGDPISFGAGIYHF